MLQSKVAVTALLRELLAGRGLQPEGILDLAGRGPSVLPEQLEQVEGRGMVEPLRKRSLMKCWQRWLAWRLQQWLEELKAWLAEQGVVDLAVGVVSILPEQSLRKALLRWWW